MSFEGIVASSINTIFQRSDDTPRDSISNDIRKYVFTLMEFLMHRKATYLALLRHENADDRPFEPGNKLSGPAFTPSMNIDPVIDLKSGISHLWKRDGLEMLTL